MDEFPFSEDEWAKVEEAAHGVTNATLANDDVLRASLLIELERVLEELRAGHGNHPVLVETEADFQDIPTKQLELYRSALQLAVQNRLSTISIRIAC